MNGRKFLKAVCLCAGAVWMHSLSGALVYVDCENGNDETGDGSELAPFKTFHKGLDSGGCVGEGMCLAPGTYALTNDVIFGRNTNRSPFPRVYGMGDSTADVVIDGRGRYSWRSYGYQSGAFSVTFSNLYSEADIALNTYGTARGYNLPNPATSTIFSNCVMTCCQSDSYFCLAVHGGVRLIDCVITNCSAGSALIDCWGGCQIERCQLLGNTSTGDLIAMSTFSYGDHEAFDSSHVAQSTFAGNETKRSAVSLMPIVSQCRFLNNRVVYGVCYYYQNFKNTPLKIQDSVFDGNVTTSTGNGSGCSGIYITNAQLTNSVIENCVLENGSAPNCPGWTDNGGGAMRLQPAKLFGSGLTVRNVRISGYTVGLGHASAIWMNYNQTAEGPGLVTFENCTIADNDATQSAVYYYDTNNGRTVFKNCVFSNGLGEGPRVHGIKGAKNWDPGMGYANMSNCLFASAVDYAFDPAQKILNGEDAKFQSDSYVPANKSPLVDAGHNDLSWMATAWDLQRDADGNPVCKRIVNEVVDIGAYEFRPVFGFMLLLR